MSIIPKQNLIFYAPLDGHSLDMIRARTTATFDPNYKSVNITLSNGNLTATGSAISWYQVRSTIAVSSGKWYWEIRATNQPNIILGIVTSTTSAENYCGSDTTSYGYRQDALKFNNAGYVSYGATYTTNDYIGIALDMDAGTLTYYKNGASQGVAFSGISGTYYASFSCYGAMTANANFSGSFVYSAPAGFNQGLFNFTSPNNGTVTGALPVPSQNPAIPASLAYKFNGSSDYLVIPDSSIYHSADSTIMMWVKFNTVAATKMLFFNQDGVESKGYTLALNSSSQLTFISKGSATVTLTGVAPKANIWYFVAVKFATGGSPTMFVSEKVYTTASTNTVQYTASHNPTIGAKNLDGTTRSQYINATVQDFSIWNKSLSHQEIQAIYNQSKHKYSTQATVLWAILQLASSITDTFNLTEVTSRLLAMNTSATDTITPTDVSTAFRAFTATVIEIITSSDVYTNTQSFLSTITDTITNSDTFTAIRWFVSTVTETITSSETTNAWMALFSTIVDTITTVDETAANFFRSIKPRMLDAIKSIPKLIWIDNNKPRGL